MSSSPSYECVADALGKFTCKFNDSVQTGCTRDSDCAVNAALCYQGKSWSAVQPSQCACYVSYGLMGANCDESGDQTYGVYVVNGLFIFFSVMVLVVSLHSAWRLRVYKLKLASTHHFTVLMLLLSGVCSLAAGLVYYSRTTGKLQFDIDASTGKKTVPQELTANILFGLWFASTSFAALNVSVTWLYLAVISERNNRALPRRYRGVLMVYFLAMGATVIGLIVTNNAAYIPVVCIPGIAYIALGYLFVHFRVKRTIAKAAAARVPGDEAKLKADMGLNLLLREASRTSLAMSLAALVVIVLMILGLLVTEDTPAYPTALLLVRIAYLVAEVLALKIAFYTLRFSHVDSSKHWQHHTATSTATANRNGAATHSRHQRPSAAAVDDGDGNTYRNTKADVFVLPSESAAIMASTPLLLVDDDDIVTSGKHDDVGLGDDHQPNEEAAAKHNV